MPIEVSPADSGRADAEQLWACSHGAPWLPARHRRGRNHPQARPSRAGAGSAHTDRKFRDPFSHRPDTIAEMASFCWQDQTIDLQLHMVRSPTETTSLSDNEVALLTLLHAADGAPVARSTLREALGIHPQVESRALHHAITRLRKKLGAACIQTIRGKGYRLQASPAPALTPAPTPGPARPSLIGRGALLAALAQHASAPLVTLTGPGGIGKSWLARTWCGERGCQVDLSAAATERDLLWLVGQALGAPPRTQSIDQARSEVARAVQSQALSLLLLDNIEHILDPARRLVQELSRDGGPSVLVTSRIALGLPGEQILPVGSLDMDDARALFAQASGRCDRDDDLTALLSLLDGVPLAIRLAAARTRILSVPDLTARLQHQPSILRRSTHHEGARHQTMEGAFEVSWSLLSASEQAGLAALTVFSGEFSLAAAEDALGDDTIELLEQLIQQSLVEATARSGGIRYRLFTVTRFFAEKQLSEADRYATWARHLAWYARRCAAILEALDGPHGDRALDQIRTDYTELKAAARRGSSIDVVQAAVIYEALHYLALQNATIMAPSFLNAAIESARTRPAIEARLRIVQSAMLFRGRRMREAIDASNRALSLLPDPPAVPAVRATVLMGRSNVRAVQGDSVGAHADASEALSIASDAGLETLQVSALVTLATQATREGRYADSEAALLQASTFARGRLYPHASVMLALSIVYTRQGWFVEAMTCARQAREGLIRLKDHWNIAIATRTIASLELANNNLDSAEQTYREALRDSRTTGNVMSAGFCLSNLALVSIHRGDLKTAARQATEAVMVHRLHKHQLPEISALQLLALLSTVLASPPRADSYLQRADQLLVERLPDRLRARQVALRGLIGTIRGEPDAAQQCAHARTLELDGRARDLLLLASAITAQTPPAVTDPLVKAFARHVSR